MNRTIFKWSKYNNEVIRIEQNVKFPFLESETCIQESKTKVGGGG